MSRFVPIYRPLVSEDDSLMGPVGFPLKNVVSHVYFDGGKLIDTRGNQWVMNGTVPISPGDETAGLPAGGGPFADSNQYQLGTGADILDFTADFTIAIVFSGDDLGTNKVLLGNGDSSFGYVVQNTPAGTQVQIAIYGAGGAILVAPALTQTKTLNVFTCGASGTNLYAMINGVGPATTNLPGPRSVGNGVTCYLSRYPVGTGFFYAARVCELYATTATPTINSIKFLDAMVRARLGQS